MTETAKGKNNLWGGIIFAILAVTIPVFYLAGSTPGFNGPALPLDDTYIHLDFARNLSNGHGLAFNPDKPSAGTTSPLWAMLLAILAVLGLPLAWSAIALGWLAFVAIGILIPQLVKKDEHHSLWVWKWFPSWLWVLAGPVIFLALSGMETMLSLAVGLAAIHWRRRIWLTGLLIGLNSLLRMENLMLLPIIILLLSLDRKKPMGIKETLILTLTALLPLIPLLARNGMLTGSIFPGTWQGKRWFLEYSGINFLAPINIFAYWLSYADYQVWGVLGREPLLLHLLPLNLGAIAGMIFLSWLGLKREAYREITGVFIWSLGLFLAYGLMLPNLGGAGRYVAPVWLALALGLGYGLAWLWEKLPQGKILAILLALLSLGGWGQGAWEWREIYDSAGDHIASVHLKAGSWCRDHLKKADGSYPVLAAFDIGALRYVYPGNIVDIGGLEEPEILPFLAKGDIKPYLQLRGVEYLALVHSYQLDEDLSERLGLAGEKADDVRLVELTEPFAYPWEKLMRHWPATGNAFPIMVISRIQWMNY